MSPFQPRKDTGIIGVADTYLRRDPLKLPLIPIIECATSNHLGQFIHGHTLKGLGESRLCPRHEDTNNGRPKHTPSNASQHGVTVPHLDA